MMQELEQYEQRDKLQTFKNKKEMKITNEQTKNIMKTKTEHELLQNFANRLGLTVHVYTHEDKRRNNQFCVYKDSTSVSGLMDYNECNHFFLGWLASKNK